ncbi:hypothetical protein Bbelb_100200 [Branchiostoma belcheri]|nr:hypothetical protein Bbelb_100200 [Branchiostoma belcheri]
MYEQAERVNESAYAGLVRSGNRPTGGPPSAGHQGGPSGGVRHGYDGSGVKQEAPETSSDTYEDAEAVKLQGPRLRQAEPAPPDGTGRAENMKRHANLRSYTTDTSSAPSDFYLFPKLKFHLRGQRFDGNDDVIYAV